MTEQQEYQKNALQCSERVSLPLKNRVWKGQSGDFVGAGVGSSMDFEDHRNYMPGDAPRHINWQAYARTGTYTMKQYREEVRPTVDLIMDVSPSMFFDPKKQQRSSELLYLTHASAMRNGADLSVHFLNGSHYIPVSHDMIQSTQWTKLLGKESELITATPELQRVPLRHNSVRVFISDLLFEGDPSPIITLLHQRQGKAIVLSPFLKSEANPEWSGNYDFIDAEQQTKHQHRVDASTLKKYKTQYANHFKLWVHASERFHSPFARVCADQSLFESLETEAIPQQALQFNQS